MEDSPKSVPGNGRPWTASVAGADIKKMKPSSLVDDMDELLEDEDSITRAQIMGSERLRSLMGKPRNHIVALPDERATARFFYCSSCGGIPFPDSSPEDDKRTVRVCGRGHPICEKCYNLYDRCLFSMRDYVNMFNKPPTVEALNQHTTPGEGCLRGEGLVRFCSEEKTTANCGLLTEMIQRTEFACSYFYNWCAFRGRGNELRDHEAICEYYKPIASGTEEVDKLKEASTVETGSVEGSEGADDDDNGEQNEDDDGEDEEEDPDETAILNFDLDDACRKIGDLGRQLKRKYGEDIFIATIPPE